MDQSILKNAFENSIERLQTPLINYSVCRYCNWNENVDPVIRKGD